MFWLRLSGWLFVLLVLATAFVMAVGNRLPSTEHMVRSATIPGSPDQLFSLLTDPASQAHWRSEVTATELLPEQNGRPCWLEQHGHTDVPVCVVDMTRPGSLVLHTANARLPFEVERRFVLRADPASPGSTRVTAEETTSITPPMLRFYHHFVTGDHAQLEQLLADLAHAGPSSGAAPAATP